MDFSLELTVIRSRDRVKGWPEETQTSPHHHHPLIAFCEVLTLKVALVQRFGQPIGDSPNTGCNFGERPLESVEKHRPSCADSCFFFVSFVTPLNHQILINFIGLNIQRRRKMDGNL
jgi:hypothetical protein